MSQMKGRRRTNRNKRIALLVIRFLRTSRRDERNQRRLEKSWNQ